MIENSLDLGSNSITNNVNAMSLARNAPVNAILSLQNQGGNALLIPRLRLGISRGHCPPDFEGLGLH